MYLRMGWYGLESSSSGFGPVEDSFEHGNEPSDGGKFLSSCRTRGFSRRAQLHEVS
jgi:hypothetical protein